jgi:hypothetical protein
MSICTTWKIQCLWDRDGLDLGFSDHRLPDGPIWDDGNQRFVNRRPLKRWPQRTAVSPSASWLEHWQLSAQGWCTQERRQHATCKDPKQFSSSFGFVNLFLNCRNNFWMSRKQQDSMLVRRVLSALEARSAEALIASSNWDLLSRSRVGLRHSAASCPFRCDRFVWLGCPFYTHDAPFRIWPVFDCIWSEAIQFRKQLFRSSRWRYISCFSGSGAIWGC